MPPSVAIAPLRGTGGMEFSVLLCFALLAVAADDRGRRAGMARASVPR